MAKLLPPELRSGRGRACPVPGMLACVQATKRGLMGLPAKVAVAPTTNAPRQHHIKITTRRQNDRH